MARKQKPAKSGVPEWLVTFADLMSILVCFFVLIISFSIQDKQKLQVVAGSMRDAFGVRSESLKNGIIELEGIPERDYLKRVSVIEQQADTDFADFRHDQHRKQGAEANTHDIEHTDSERPRQFALAAASLRQAWEELPDITEISDNIIVEETEEGLYAISVPIVDADGRVRAALAVSGPTARLSGDRVPPTVETLTRAAGEIAAKLFRVDAVGDEDGQLRPTV